MHYTSWDRGDRDRPRLLAEEGPLELAVFDAAAEKADVAGEVWELSYSKDLGATATLADGSERVVALESANHHRLWRCPVEVENCVSLTLEPLETWGAETVRIFAFEAE